MEMGVGVYRHITLLEIYARLNPVVLVEVG
jgi:hypothetical protein